MSIADESQVPHRPPQIGDDVEVRLRGTVTVPADEVAILRDVPRHQRRP